MQIPLGLCWTKETGFHIRSVAAEKESWPGYQAECSLRKRAPEEIFASHWDSSWDKCSSCHLTAARQEWSPWTRAVLTLLYMGPAGLLKLLLCASAANLGESNTLNVRKKVSKLFILIVAIFFWLVCLSCVSQLHVPCFSLSLLTVRYFYVYLWQNIHAGLSVFWTPSNNVQHNFHLFYWTNM